MYKSALYTFEKIGDECAPEIALCKYNIGISFYLQEKYSDAQSFLYSALKINLEQNENHPNTASCYHFIGCIHDKEEKYEAAIENLLEALKIRLFTLGNTHPRYGETYKQVQDTYKKSGLSKDSFESWLENKMM
jgi:tetratricopeptide (TPR) repeat protein